MRFVKTAQIGLGLLSLVAALGDSRPAGATVIPPRQATLGTACKANTPSQQSRLAYSYYHSDGVRNNHTSSSTTVWCPVGMAWDSSGEAHVVGWRDYSSSVACSVVGYDAWGTQILFTQSQSTGTASGGFDLVFFIEPPIEPAFVYAQCTIPRCSDSDGNSSNGCTPPSGWQDPISVWLTTLYITQ